MNRVYVKGTGAVSPAGWTAAQLCEVAARGEALAVETTTLPNSKRPFQVRRVPALKPLPPVLQHARLRRTSNISSFTISAAAEALGPDLDAVKAGTLKLGVVSCVLGGCIQFTRRFYEEAWRNPASASPLIFPETVFNAPSSHLAAILGSTSINYTIVGDAGTFFQGLALGARWIAEGRVNGCVIVGAEEFDWLTADALRRFSRATVGTEGAGAIYLSAQPTSVELKAITDSYLFTDRKSRVTAVGKMQASLKELSPETKLCDSGQSSLTNVFGEGLMAGAAWQAVVAAGQVREKRLDTALVSFAGSHQQAIGACFARNNLTT